ncbi:MAG: nucleotidyltransferase family protein [Pseudomonadota bacterium]
MGITGILLAAGRGKRFDPSGARNKLLQAVDGSVVVVNSARHMLAVMPRVVAVVRPGDDGVAAQLLALGCDVTVCESADSGMAASLVHALRHAEQKEAAQGWLIALGDMPRVRPATIQSLQDALERGADIAVPVFQGRRGNPVGFTRTHLPLLLALQGDQGARGILKNHPVHEVAVDDNGILQDIDTPADLHPEENHEEDRTE